MTDWGDWELYHVVCVDDEPPEMDEYEATAPCPHCFESCGYVVEHGNDWNSGPYSHQTNIPCRVCDGTGLVPASEVGPDDERDEDFYDPGYLAALDAQVSP